MSRPWAAGRSPRSRPRTGFTASRPRRTAHAYIADIAPRTPRIVQPATLPFELGDQAGDVVDPQVLRLAAADRRLGGAGIPRVMVDRPLAYAELAAPFLLELVDRLPGGRNPLSCGSAG